MNITEYYLKITQSIGGAVIHKELIYRGNENVGIQSMPSQSIDGISSIKVPLHVLKKFIEMIE